MTAIHTFPASPSYGVTEDGRVQRLNSGRWLKPGSAKNGYLTVSLWEGGKGRTWYVHRIVAEAFFGPRPPRCDVAHYDGDKLNNHISNLRWASRSENNSDKHRHGRHRRPDCQKLTDQQVNEVRARRLHGEPPTKIAQEYGVSQSLISMIAAGKRRMGTRHVGN